VTLDLGLAFLWPLGDQDQSDDPGHSELFDQPRVNFGFHLNAPFVLFLAIHSL
jgi:hypothetical protein